MKYQEFSELVWDYYRNHERVLPWRMPEVDGSFDPYKILVSEIMLQQTQAQRVIPKYHEFLALFPTVAALASAPLQSVLVAWSGLGYNRRAKFLWQAAQYVQETCHGVFPATAEELVRLPGVGPNTAAAICAYAFNQPVVFIETNIRTIYIYHFFPEEDQISDAQLMPIIAATVDAEHPREWYWALMDYGVHIKATVGNASRSSKHYTKQSKFEGSRRQIRGQVLRVLATGPMPRKSLESQIEDARLSVVIDALIAEGLIAEHDKVLSL